MVRLKASDSTWNPFRWWRPALVGAGLFVALVLVALALAGFAGKWRYLELMSDFRPHLVVIAWEMIRGTGFSEARQGIGFVPTTHADGWLARWLPRCIDHALHAGGIVVHALRTGPPLGSDHLPLVVEFSLP